MAAVDGLPNVEVTVFGAIAGPQAFGFGNSIVDRNPFMTARSGHLIRVIMIALVIFVLFGIFGLPLITIQFRLWKNGAIANELAQSLHTRFPKNEFRGAASYESEIIYISVVEGRQPESRSDIEQWLRNLKIEQKIEPNIWLLFPGYSGMKKDAIVF